MVVFGVLYPAQPGSRFDWAYCHATHIPLVKAITQVSAPKS